MSNLKKYSSILIKGTAAVSLANASTQIVGLLLLPIFTFYLSPEDYGIFSLVSLTITVLALIYNPGMMSATMRLYHKTDDEDDRKTLIGSALIFFLLIPFVPIIFGLLFGPQIFSYIFKDFEFYPYGFLALILAFFIQPSRIWSTLMTLKYKVKKAALHTAISVTIGMLFSVLFVVVFKMGAMGKVLGMFPAALYLFIISLKEVREYTLGVWKLESIKKQLIFGYPLIAALWAYQGLNFIGKYMLESMDSIESVGLYSFAVSLASVPMILVLGFKQLWNPIFYENMNLKNYKTISQLITYFILVLTLLCILCILFSKEVILLVINERYYSIIPIIGFLILGIFFNGLLTISNSLLSYDDKFRNVSIIALIAIFLNFTLNVVLIPEYNVLGASISLAASYFIFFVIGAINQKKTLKLIQTKGITLFPILIIFSTVIICYFLNQTYEINTFNKFEFGVKVSLFGIVLLIFFKINLLRKEDLNLLISLIRQKIKK